MSITAPLIPSYLVIRSLGMENHLTSLIVPGALIFIRDKRLYPIQLVLRNLVVDSMASAYSSVSLIDLTSRTTPEQMQAGIIVFATIPIICIYPFLQKYFVKGAMIGSLKG